MKQIELPESNHQATRSRRGSRRRRRVVGQPGRFISGIFRLLVKLLLVLTFVAIGLFVGSFLQFTNKVTNAVEPSDVAPSQAIVVLTGGPTRIATALQLLAEKKGTRLLITGVNVVTHRADIQAMHKDQARLIECCVDLEHVAEDTIGNAVETAKWMHKRGYNSAIVVTSAYHMPRSLLEFRREMPDVSWTPYPVPLDTTSQQGWWKDAVALRFMINEFLKYLGARIRSYVGDQTLDTLRGNVLGEKQD